MDSRATLSPCEKYRYALSRTWDQEKGYAMFIMLNPSTADAYKDDPTIRRCIGYARSWGYGGIKVGNLFPYRATDPRELLKATDVVGKGNRQYLQRMAEESKVVVCAWGNGPLVEKILKKMPEYKPLEGVSDFLYYLDLAKDGTPKHPLYLKKDLIPQQLT